MTAPGAPLVQVLLLGTPRLLTPAGESKALERRDAALLALLAIEGATLRSRAAALLWPDLSDKAARSNLRQRLFRLRRAAGDGLVIADETLRLGPDAHIDLREAPAALSQNPAACIGALLGEHDYSDTETLADWVAAARERWCQTRLELLAAEASRHEDALQVVEALRYAQRIVAEHPLHEHGQRRLMRLHYLRGDRAAALAVFEAFRVFMVKEFGVDPDRETLELARLVESGSELPRPAAPPRPVAALRPPRLVGSEPAWRVLAHACDTHRSVLVDGDAGAGKSRLLTDFASSRTSEVALFAARPGDAQHPYALLAQVANALSQRFGPPQADWARSELARIAPCLGPAPTARLDHLRFRQALQQALDDWRQAGLELVVLDDLHFADDASLDLLPTLLASSSSTLASPIVWLLGVRTLEIPPALQACLPGLDARSLVRLQLGPLDAGAVCDLIASLRLDALDAEAWAPALTRHAGGNPLFVLETLMALLRQAGGVTLGAPPLRLPIPATVQQLVAQRLQRLSSAAHLLAQVAAVAGQDLSPELAADVMKRPLIDIATLWAELESAQVLRGQDFAHDLIQASTQASLPGALARVLHGDVARYLSARATDPARLAHHHHRAEHWPQAGLCYLQAAAIAERASQRRLESDLAAEAAACFLKAGDREREFVAREHQVRAALYIESFERQVKHALALIDLAATPRQRSIALEAYARILVTDIQDQKIIDAGSEARGLAAGLGDVALELKSASLEARALARLNRLSEAGALIARYVPVAKSQGLREHAARALADFGCALMTCDRADEAELLFNAALSMATQLEDWSQCQELYGHLAWVQQYRGDIVRVAQAYEAARDLAPRLGADARPADLTESIRGRCYMELGRYTEALSLLETTLARQRQSPGYGMVSATESTLCKLHLWLGQPARAATVLTAPGPDAPAMNHRLYLCARALIAIQLEQPAIGLLDEALAMARQEGSLVYALNVQALRARVLPADEGAALALEACGEAEALGQHMALWPLKLAASDALQRSGQARHAATVAGELRQRLQRFAPAGFYAPDYWWVISQCLRGVGDDPGADHALTTAADWIREVALPQVPAEFRASFLDRNPVNRTVLLAAAQTAQAERQ